MTQLKIGIVEDELIIAESLKHMLISVGYLTTEAASRYSEAIDMIEQEKPDLVLLDINLSGQLDGVDLAHVINKNFMLPIIFLTANANHQTIQRVKDLCPAAFLAKPISKEQLFAAIEIAFNNFTSASSVSKESLATNKAGFIFLKDGGTFHKIYLNQILYIESEANYVSVHLNDKTKILVRTTLNEFCEKLDKNKFIRIHRSYVVNLMNIDRINAAEIVVRGTKIPFSKTYKAELMKIANPHGMA